MTRTDLPAGASPDAIRSHYDAGNAFYAAWLDPSMTYSAARWTGAGRGPRSLEEAQAAKLDWHLDSASVRPGAQILDVGCGWGSLLARAIGERKAARAVGVTPSLCRRASAGACSAAA
jgi:cyclopropane-fatty-acyl-phospholipid synthase